MFKYATAILMLTAVTAQADLTARFDEGAPKDRFIFTNTGGCALAAFDIELDLGAAPAGLIFDVTASGPGVEVYQPLVLIAGQDMVRGIPKVKDGDSIVSFTLKGLGIDQSLAFTIDVDDTGGGREITVNGSEISGALVKLTQGSRTDTGVFDATARAVVPVTDCQS